MENLTELWNKSKGKLLVAGITLILGTSAASYLGVGLVNGPDGSVCIGAVEQPVE